AYSGGTFPGSDVFGYRLMPGILVYFLLGSFLYDIRNGSRLRLWTVLLAVVVLVGLWWVFLGVHGTLDQDYTRGSLLGLVGGAFLVTGLGKVRRRKTDEILGHLSYGVYLNHFFVLWALLPVLFSNPTATTGWMEAARILVYLAGSLVLAWLGWWALDNPIMHWRRRRRARLEQLEPGIAESRLPS